MKLLLIIALSLVYYWMGVLVASGDLQPIIDKYEKEQSKSKVYQSTNSIFQYEDGNLYEVSFEIEGKDTIVVMDELIKLNQE